MWLAFGGSSGSFQNATSGNDRRYQYRFSSNRPKRDTIQSAVQSFSRGMHRRRITLYYQSDAYCDVIKSYGREAPVGNRERTLLRSCSTHIIILYAHYSPLGRVMNNCKHPTHPRINPGLAPSAAQIQISNTAKCEEVEALGFFESSRGNPATYSRYSATIN